MEKEVVLTCNLPRCNKTYTQPYPGNTTTLLHHTRTKHANVLLQMAEDAKESGLPEHETILGTNLLEGLMDASKGIDAYFKLDESKPQPQPQPQPKPKPKQKLEPKRQPSHADCNPKYFQKRFTQFIIGLDIPFNTCDHFLTKKMIDGAKDGLSSVISRGQFILQVKKMYFREVMRLKKEFAEHDGRFALTIDEWTSSNDNQFLGITVHFIDKSFELKYYHIGLEHIAKNDDNAESIAESLNRVLRYYKIDDRIISINRDHTSVMTKVVSIFKKSDHGKCVDKNFKWDILCFRHVCNLTVKALMTYAFPKKTNSDTNNDPMEDEIYPTLPPNVRGFPGKVRKLIRAVNRSDMLGYLFDKAVAKREQTDNSKIEQMKKDYVTTWLSEFEMIDSILYFKEQIIEVLNEFNDFSPAEKKRIGVSEITESEWEYLKVLRDILCVFVEPMKGLQAVDHETIFATIPTIHLLLKKLNKMNTETLRSSYPNISSGLIAAHDKLYKYYPIYEEDCGDLAILYIATVLHPMFKLKYFQTRKLFSPSLANSIKKNFEDIFRLYEEYYREQRSKIDENVENSPQSDYRSHKVNFRDENFPYIDLVYDIENEEDEVAAYLSEKLEKSNVNSYYRYKENIFPTLYQFAKDIMAIPAMSAPEESYFSTLSNIITKERNKVYPATTKMVAVVKEMIRKMRPGDPESDMESDDEDIEDDAELSRQVLREIKDCSD